jgi:pyroglutamyl-peptidase
MIPKSGTRFSDKVMRKNNMRVVIAGFGPFHGAPFNPSERLAIALARRRRPALAGIDLTSHIFATAYQAVDCDLPKLLAREPDVLLIFGLAARRPHICIETRARNARSVLFPDVSGFCPKYTTIESGRPGSLIGNAPFPHLLYGVRKSALPARLSRDAGAYLCNYAYWRALQHSENRTLVQFVHIPSAGTMSPRSRFKNRASPLSRLVAACEQLLISLIAARRSSHRLSNGSRPLSEPARPRNRSSCAKLVPQSARERRARPPRAAKTAR